MVIRRYVIVCRHKRGHLPPSGVGVALGVLGVPREPGSHGWARPTEDLGAMGLPTRPREPGSPRTGLAA